jgi:eukaryotic-like serine/threonine-protein kinase
MPDDLHPGLLPTADLPQNVEEPSTNDATRSASTFDREFRRSVPDPTAPKIPGYAITGEIARGGMGKVYAAKDQSLEREVAIKTLLPGADATRFVTESKITARLPHPGIPPVYALGRLDDGTPYLAMKLIRGRTVAALLQERLSPADDLARYIAVFEQIAQAAGFAHEQGIIHRDLKPLNVMAGAFGEVQVMDWGLAKDLSDSREAQPSASTDADDLALTSAGAVMGTPGYMAPEQARGEPADARADVFALGAILAAILTGKPAFVGTTARETIEKAARGDLSETLERLAASGADSELIALANDCLQVDPSKRPAEAKQVAQRVADYRLGVEERLKQAETAKAEALVREAEGRKRRRAMQWAAGIIAIVLIGGIVGTGFGMVRAKESASKEKSANELTTKRMKQIERINNGVFDMFADFDVRKVKNGPHPVEYVLGERLVQFGKTLDDQVVDDPLVLATLRDRLGTSLINLGRMDEAIDFLTAARAVREEALGSDHPDSFVSSNNLAVAYAGAGKPDLALPLMERASSYFERTLGPDHRESLVTLSNVAECLDAVGNLNKAFSTFERAVSSMKSHLGVDDPDTLTTMSNYAAALKGAGKPNEALLLHKEVHKLRLAKLGADHPDTLTSVSGMADAYTELGKYDLALPLLENAIGAINAKLGPDHPVTLSATGNLGNCLVKAGKSEKGTLLLKESLERKRKKLGIDHPLTLDGMSSLGYAYMFAREWDKAIPLLEETLKLRKTRYGTDHSKTLSALANLATCHLGAERLAEAKPLLEESLELLKRKKGPNHTDTIISMSNLGHVCLRLQEKDRAVKLFEEALARSKESLGPGDPVTYSNMTNLAEGYAAVGKFDLALPLFEEAHHLMRTRLGASHPRTLSTMVNLGRAYCTMGKGELAASTLQSYVAIKRARPSGDPAEFAALLVELAGELFGCAQYVACEQLLCEGLSIRQKAQPDAWNTFNTQSLLGAALLGQKKYPEAEPLLLKGYEGMKAREKSIPPQGKTRIPEAIDRLIELYTAINKPDEVKKWKAERAKYSNSNSLKN